MNMKICDKCGNKINTNPMVNITLPKFIISKIEDLAIGPQSVDLCSECEKKLVEWLNNKQEIS